MINWAIASVLIVLIVSITLIAERYLQYKESKEKIKMKQTHEMNQKLVDDDK